MRVFLLSRLEQTVLDLGVLPHLQSLLRHPKKNIRKVTEQTTLTAWDWGRVMLLPIVLVRFVR